MPTFCRLCPRKSSSAWLCTETSSAWNHVQMRCACAHVEWCSKNLYSASWKRSHSRRPAGTAWGWSPGCGCLSASPTEDKAGSGQPGQAGLQAHLTWVMCPDNPLPSVLVKPCLSRPPRGAGWTGSLTLWADVRLPHICAYGDNRDRHAAEKGDPSLDPGPCRPSSLAGSSSAAPPTSRDLADPVQLRLTLHGHPLQGGQVKYRAAADVVIVVPAPVEIVVRELVMSEGERGLRHQAQAAPPPRTDQREAWHKLGPPPKPGLGTLHQPALPIGPTSTEPCAPLKGHAHSERPRPLRRATPTPGPPAPPPPGPLTPSPSLQRQLCPAPGSRRFRPIQNQCCSWISGSDSLQHNPGVETEGMGRVRVIGDPGSVTRAVLGAWSLSIWGSH